MSAWRLLGRVVRQSAIWIIAASCVLIGVYALRFVNQVQVGVSHDDAEYVILAESFATGQPYRLVSHPRTPIETTWPPGYPLFVLTLPYLLFGPNLDVLRLINVALALLAGWLGFLLLRHFTVPSLALLAAGLFAINPHTVKWATLTMSDIPFTVAVFSFCLIYLRWKSRPPRPQLWFTLAVLSLAVAILMRYWGVAFLAAAGLDLLFERRWRAAIALGLGTVLLVLPFPIFLALQPDAASSSFYALQSVSRSLDKQLASAGVSLITYGETVPLLLVPLLGPAVSQALATIRLDGIIIVVHMAIWLVLIAGAWQVWRRHRLPVLMVLCYLALLILLTEHLNLQTIVFDEPRYLVPITLFLNLFLIEGTLPISRRLPRADRWAKAAVILLFVILIGRNVQQAMAENNFPVSDLSAGTDWIQANTNPSDVFMSVDSIGRYIYLRRPMLDFPNSAEEFWQELKQYQVRYLLIADSLNAIKNSWSIDIGTQPDQVVESVIRPIVKRYPKCFGLIHLEAETNAEIYRVNPDCLSRPLE